MFDTLLKQNTSSKNFKFGNLLNQRATGIRVVEKGSWKNKKLESFKFEWLKLESFCLSWKEPYQFNFQTSIDLSNFINHFPTSALTLRLQPELSNFIHSNYMDAGTENDLVLFRFKKSFQNNRFGCIFFLFFFWFLCFSAVMK